MSLYDILLTYQFRCGTCMGSWFLSESLQNYQAYVWSLIGQNNRTYLGYVCDSLGIGRLSPNKLTWTDNRFLYLSIVMGKGCPCVQLTAAKGREDLLHLAQQMEEGSVFSQLAHSRFTLFRKTFQIV